MNCGCRENVDALQIMKDFFVAVCQTGKGADEGI